MGWKVRGGDLDTERSLAAAGVRPPPRRAHPYHYRIDGREIGLLDLVRFEYEGDLDDPSQPENVALGDSRWELTAGSPLLKPPSSLLRT
jgi:hypothetical protein